MQDAVRAILYVSVRYPDPIGRDNLEFLQWIKRFWESNYGGHPYDPVARRKGVVAEPPATLAPLATARSAGAVNSRAGGRTPVGGHRAGSAMSNEAVHHMQEQLKEMSSHLDGLEKERDFYFAKVRLCRSYVWFTSPDHPTSSGISRSWSSSKPKSSKRSARRTKP